MAYTTRKTLLEQIRSGDEISWEEFYRCYRPLVKIRAADYRLNAPESDELLQSVMLRFFDRSRTFVYDRGKGRFRDYLGVMIHHCALNIIRARRSKEVSIGDHDFFDGSGNDDERWLEEWRTHLIEQALEILKGQIAEVTYQAFELYALHGRKADAVASFLNISVGSVYVAKNRASAKLAVIIRQLEEQS